MNTSTSQPPPIPPTTSPAPTSPDSIILLNHPISTKLTRTNYLAWKSQIEPVLYGYGLHKYLTSPAPSQYITVGTQTIENPAHRQDQLILGWIRSSLSETLLGQVVSCASSSALWSHLQQTFSESCQVCFKRGHTALICWYCYDERYANGPPQAFIAQPQQPSPTPDWYLDSGATHHVTSDLNNLSSYIPYEGMDSLHIGNGTGSPHQATPPPSLATSSSLLHLSSTFTTSSSLSWCSNYRRHLACPPWPPI